MEAGEDRRRIGRREGAKNVNTAVFFFLHSVIMRNEEEKGTFIMSSCVCECVRVSETEFQTAVEVSLEIKTLGFSLLL